MDNRTFLIVAVTISVVVFAGGSGKSGSGGLPIGALAVSIDTSTRDTAAPRARFSEGERLLTEFLGRPPTADTAVDGIIATLPDPVASHLDWGWDANLEAILRAFE